MQQELSIQPEAFVFEPKSNGLKSGLNQFENEFANFETLDLASEIEAESLLSRPERVFQLTAFGYARHRLSRAHVAAILNEIAPYIIRHSDSISRIEVIGFSSGTRRQYFHAEQRAINTKNALFQILRDKFGAPAALLGKIELAAVHRSLPPDLGRVSNPEHRKAAIQVFFYGGSEMETAAGAIENDIASTPKSGSFYRIKRGDTLLGVAGRAFGVPAGQARLAYARFINGYPLNRKYYVRGSGDFTQTYFPNGIISFTPKFACEQTAIDAPIGRGSCFPLIYIPKIEVLDRRSALVGRRQERGSLSQAQQGPGAVRSLSGFGSMSACTAPKAKRINDATAVPYRWTCMLTITLEDGQGPFRGSGFLIAPDIVLTAGHILFDITRTGPSSVPKPLFSKKIVVELGANYLDGKNRTAFPAYELDLKEGTNFLMAKKWTRAIKDFFAIPPGANYSRRVGVTTVKENQFDFGIIRIPELIGNKIILRGTREVHFGHWGAQGSNTLLGANSIAAVNRAKSDCLSLSISGYPMEPGDQRRSVVRQECVGRILTDVNSLVEYAERPSYEDSGGSSGGPIFLEESTPGLMRETPPLRVIGVHGHVGHGVILTENVLAEIERMKSELR